jgi:dissimilatory sulfite reductase (desulfoviridin) alpha/beta subunit
MDDPEVEADTVLQLECPRCGDRQQDDFETIAAWRPTAWRCGGCGRGFSVLLAECDHCASEAVFVALSGSELPVERELTCPRCARSCLLHEELAQADWLD